MTETSRDLAIFDLDYTLTKRGTWGRFVWQMVKTRPHLWLPLLISAGTTQFRYKQGKIPRVKVKMAMMRWCMVGKPRAEMLAAAELFASREVPDGLRPGAIYQLNQHKVRGDVIMIVSAAADIIANAIARNLGVEHVIATDMGWDGNDCLSAEFASANCYGPEKVTRLTSYLGENPRLKQNHTLITMYSDSYSDLDILRFCDKGVAVNPDKKLAGAAEELGFNIVDWNK